VPNATPARGRPRIAELDERILAATRALLAEHGYLGLSMEAVAKRAGVGKQTLYRRWPRRPLLVYKACFGGAEQTSAELPDTGTLAGDLARATAYQDQVFKLPGTVELISGMVADCLVEPDLMAALRRKMMRPDLDVAATIFARAVKRGELPPTTDIHALAEIMAGAMFAHHILYGDNDPGFQQTLSTTLSKLAD
jgi:AcrR family transcriptional regulator